MIRDAYRSRFLIKFIFVAVTGCHLPQLALAQFEHFIPQVVDGADQPLHPDRFFRTEFHVVNLSKSEVNVEIELTQNDGQPMSRIRSPGLGPGGGTSSQARFVLAPLGQQTVATTNAPFTQIGWAIVRSSGPVGVVATLQYLVSGSNDVVTSTSILTDPPSEKFSAYGRISTSASTGIALLNTSSLKTALVKIQLYNNEGTLQDERTIALLPRGKIAQFLNEDSLFTGLQIFEGSIEVSSSMPLAATIIRVDKTYWSTFRVMPSRLP